MFRTVLLSINRSLFALHSAMVYVIQVRRQLSSVPSWSCSKAVYKPVWHIPLLSVQWINSGRWTDELFETCKVSWQNKFVKLVHLVGFITKKINNFFWIPTYNCIITVPCIRTIHFDITVCAIIRQVCKQIIYTKLNICLSVVRRG